MLNVPTFYLKKVYFKQDLVNSAVSDFLLSSSKKQAFLYYAIVRYVSQNRPQITSDHTIHKKSHNSQKTNSIHKIKHELTIFVGIPVGTRLKKPLPHTIS